jgi:hypothetical protein
LGIAKGPVVQDVVGEILDEVGLNFLVTTGWESLKANVKGQNSEAFAKAPKLNVKTELHQVKLQAL